MNKILFINACVRPCSRTLELAETLLQRLNGDVQAANLQELALPVLDLKGMEKRDQAAQKQDFSDPCFDEAKRFADTDIVVVAAPYWDLMFPAALKTYWENITVSGITFRYSEQGRPQSLCRAKELYYVTTAGGFIGHRTFSGFLRSTAIVRRGWISSARMWRPFCARQRQRSPGILWYDRNRSALQRKSGFLLRFSGRNGIMMVSGGCNYDA